MKWNNPYDSDSCDEDYTGQPPDDDQSFIVPRRGLEPDSGPDDEPMIVERRGSPADTDSLVFEEDMGEFIQFKWRVNRDGTVIHGFQCYRRTRRPSISYLQEHGLDLSISCQIKAISEWKLDLMAAKVFEHLTFDKGKTVKEVYKILSRCMAEEKTVRISRKAMLEKSIAKQRERLDKYIDLCADGIITKQELMDRRKGLDNQIADLQSQYESVEQEDERSGALDMNLISQKLDEWQRASKNDVDRELINSCVAQITPLTNEEFRWALDFQMSEVQARNAAAYTMDGFVEMARFSISFEEAKAFKASRNQGIRKNEWQDLTVVVGIWSKTQK